MKKTKFYDVHERIGAKIVDFAGYKMPIQYSSIIEEHKAVRSSVGVFDVSHMGEVIIRGEKALDFVQQITVNNASKLIPGKVQYSAMCYEDGGIVDDLLVYKKSDTEYMLVINASNIEKDVKWMHQNNRFNVDIIDESDDYSLLAVQGPNSQSVVQTLCDKPLDLEYYNFFETKFNGIDLVVSRTGYTGELGYEIYFKGTEEDAGKIWHSIFEAGKEFDIMPVGLAARDSLRLEMGFCLYGNDIDHTTNTLEAGLGWITKLKKGDFNGREALLDVKEKGIKRKLVPMVAEDKCFPRKGYEIKIDGESVGNITSGTVSPILGKPIALGYIEKQFAVPGQKVNFVVRNREFTAEIVELPFIKK